MPDTGELENPPYEIASEIIAKDGETLGKAFKLNREWLHLWSAESKVGKALWSPPRMLGFTATVVWIIGETARALFFLVKRG